MVVLRAKAAIAPELFCHVVLSIFRYTCTKVTNTTDLKSSSQHWNFV